ncbi:IclR family transcriptional regulator [uncultured Sulfitobacter sp.]|uniref:IclR family transcriptional regulator n=1 Tax=uncultured Sulfitobacter sp. TaxID=191468 RepID=UPI002618C99A|nr:IclR family transcriptional regulator [uncultured Sulfitobacter sp.]
MRVENVEMKSSVRDGSSLPRVRAVTRAVSILRAFTLGRPNLALGEIVKITGLDAGTTRRLLVTLRDEGLVRQDTASGLYSASIGLLELSRAVPESLSLTSLVEDRIKQLAEDTQTTVYLSTVSGDTVLCTARHNGGRAIEVRWWAVGEHRAFNKGTGPRVLLAYQPEERREAVMRDILALKPEQVADLRAELDEIRETGVIVKHDEIATGLSAMAVPLLDHKGNVLGAISTGGLSPRYKGAERSEMQKLMTKASAEMVEKLRGFIE